VQATGAPWPLPRSASTRCSSITRPAQLMSTAAKCYWGRHTRVGSSSAAMFPDAIPRMAPVLCGTKHPPSNSNAGCDLNSTSSASTIAWKVCPGMRYCEQHHLSPGHSSGFVMRGFGLVLKTYFCCTSPMILRSETTVCSGSAPDLLPMGASKIASGDFSVTSLPSN